MRILVTGGAGFIGSNLIEGLLQEGYTDIVSLDNYFSGSTDNHIEGATYITGNTWDAKTIFKERQETFDVIFHFGEYSRIASSFNDIDIISESILRGTPAIVELAKKWNSLLIYSATSSSLGNNGRDSILSPYAWMKSKMKAKALKLIFVGGIGPFLLNTESIKDRSLLLAACSSDPGRGSG